MLGYTASFGQFNDTINYYLNYSATGIINSTSDGNSYVLNHTLKFETRKKRIYMSNTNSWIYGEQQGKVLINNDFSSTIDFNTYRTLVHFYYWGYLYYTKSYSLKINNQFQGGLGVGYNLIDKKNAALILSDGILYERNDLIGAESGQNQYQTLRNSLRIKYRWVIRNILVIDGSDFLQNSLSSKNDYIIKVNTSLSIKLKKWLSLTTSITYNKFNETKRENMLLNFGFTFEKYF
jgi:hypothetical protein